VSVFLSREDVARLTCRKHRRRQIEQLVRMGIEFEIDGDGWPLVQSDAPAKRRDHMERLVIEALRATAPV